MNAEKRSARVHGLKMAYEETGEGDPIVFLHGNPTSSYLWRNVIPSLEPFGRCVAPDLIGMGDSEKLTESGPDSYTFVQHRDYLDEFLDALGVNENVTLVLHDWGSALGFDWARRHPDAVRAIAYMEAIVMPFRWDYLEENVRKFFQALRSPAGEEMILERNLFIDRVLPHSIIRKLSEEEMNVYRKPYLNPGESRRPMLTWPRQIPFDGEPAEVHEIVQRYSEWLRETRIPKLFIQANPGAIMTHSEILEFAHSLPNQQIAGVKGIHFIQEDCPEEIGSAIAGWLEGK